MNLPQEIREHTAGAAFDRQTIGLSGDEVYRVDLPDKTLFLKISGSEQLMREAQCQLWLGGRVAVPRTVAMASEGGRHYLLSSAVPGQMACSPKWLARPEKMAQIMGHALKKLHALDISDCPLKRRLGVVLDMGKARVEGHLANKSDWEADTPFDTPEELHKWLTEHRPETEDVVFTHGDYCLPNLLIDEQGRAGMIDLGRAGLADRYQDIAIGLRSLRHNAGCSDYDKDFLQAYGLEEPDEAKMRYYTLLDEIF